MARSRPNKRKSKGSPARRSTGRPKRKCRLKPVSPYNVRVLRNKKIVKYPEQRCVPFEDNLRMKVKKPLATDEIILVEDNDLTDTLLLNNNASKVKDTEIQQSSSQRRLSDYAERLVTYKPGDLNFSITRSIIPDANEQQDISETPLPRNTLKTTEFENKQDKSDINSNKTIESPLLDHITILDDTDSEKNKENMFKQFAAGNIHDMSTIRTERTLNNMYQTVDVAESDGENDDVILVNDCDENEVTYVSTTIRKKSNKKHKKSVIIIEDDSVMEVTNKPTCTSNSFNTNNIYSDQSTLLLPYEFTPPIASTPAKCTNNAGPSYFNYMGFASGVQMTQPQPSSLPIRITTNVNIPSHSQNHPLAGTLRNQALQLQQQLSNTATTIGWNFLNANDVRLKGLRPIFIDGSNVAMGHTNGKYFSVKGLKICIDYFKMRGHEVTAIVPNYRKEYSQNSDHKLLEKLEKQGTIIFTPSRKVNGKSIVPYDDRYIVLLAHVYKGIIVSADNYRDLLQENPEWLDTIENRILTPTWLKDMIMFPSDPLGRHGPTLDEFLKFPN